jgi:hypothetical protein
MRVPNLKFWSPRQRGGWKLVVHITVFDKDHDTVLAAKHTASLQLLCTVGGDLAGPRTVAKYFFFKGGRKLLHPPGLASCRFGTGIQFRLIAVYLAARTLLLADLR